MNLDSRFIAIAEEESPSFRPIVDAMFHSRKTDGERYLCALNNTIDWCLSSDRSLNGVNLQIIHIPNCSVWARELLVRFVIHKCAFTLSNVLLNQYKRAVSSDIILPPDISKKDTAKTFERRKYQKTILSTFSGIEIPNNNHKSLLLVKEQDILTHKYDKNPWLNSLFSTNFENTSHNTIVSTDTTDFLESKIRSIVDTNDMPTIENVFVFHSPNRSNVLNYYNIDQLKRLNQYGLGVKNCIVFSFSEERQGLYQVIEGTKNRLATALLKRPIRTYDEFEGFITFTTQETDFLFDQNNNQQRVIIDCQDRDYFTIEIDSVLDQIPHNLRYKNVLALAFSDDLQQQFQAEISKQVPDMEISAFLDFFNLLKQVWSDDICEKINSFIDGCQQVAFVIPRETPISTQEALKSLFSCSGRQVLFYSIEGLRNGINEEKIVVLQFRYTDRLYKSYPNSFDLLPITDNQKALILINLLTHNSYFEWNRHRYDKDQNGLLYSAFRKERLGWSKKVYPRPPLPDIRDFVGEAEADIREYITEKCTVQFIGGKPKEYSASERVLFRQYEHYNIAELRELNPNEELDLQLLDELVEQVKSLITQKTERNFRSEKIIRSDHKYCLSDEEINSSTELWRLLLRRRVEELGQKKVYEDIVSCGSNISANSLERWINLDHPMMLPRSRNDQRIILTYLGFTSGSPYHRIVLAKKLFNISNSRTLNNQVAALLQYILTREISCNFEYLQDAHSDILTLLEVSCDADIAALVDLLDIELKPAIRIS